MREIINTDSLGTAREFDAYTEADWTRSAYNAWLYSLRPVVAPVPGFLAGLRAECDRVGALLIFDEVITGFGRMGTWFAADYYDVTPDMTTFAKGVTSGYQPLGGVIVGTGGYPEDEIAIDILAKAFPDRQVVEVPGAFFSFAGGGPHCTTMQIPEGAGR